eukprot:TRINITY_DN254678_c4_g1_i1.p1 TRINITY_DN254678_c4_g1~~TRINITY_DN254678_c4_g1_i1.p1  ORF type:complete len:158 (-),score=30.33 TRINITY_DN254678_c4_g1_i1:130-603(-)
MDFEEFYAKDFKDAHLQLKSQLPKEIRRIMTDFFLLLFKFSKEDAHLNWQQASLLHNIMESTCQKMMFSQQTREESFEHFKALMLAEAVEEPQPEKFSIEEIRIITEYISNTFYRHFNLFQSCGTSNTSWHHHHDNRTVDTPSPSLLIPLSEAKLEE